MTDTQHKTHRWEWCNNLAILVQDVIKKADLPRLRFWVKFWAHRNLHDHYYDMIVHELRTRTGEALEGTLFGDHSNDIISLASRCELLRALFPNPFQAMPSNPERAATVNVLRIEKLLRVIPEMKALPFIDILKLLKIPLHLKCKIFDKLATRSLLKDEEMRFPRRKQKFKAKRKRKK